jgi:hypothetical protein
MEYKGDLLKRAGIYLATGIIGTLGLVNTTGCGDYNAGKSLSELFDPARGASVTAQGIHGAYHISTDGILGNASNHNHRKTGNDESSSKYKCGCNK